MNFKSTVKSAGAALLLSGMLAAPALASSADNGNGNNQLTGKLQKTNDLWRASDVKGANVYNSSGKQIGTIDSLLLNSSGHVTDAVISIGGFADVGNKLVEVPFSTLKFEPSQNNNSSGNSGNQENYSIVYPDATAQSIKNMSTFSYDTQSS